MYKVFVYGLAWFNLTEDLAAHHALQQRVECRGVARRRRFVPLECAARERR